MLRAALIERSSRKKFPKNGRGPYLEHVVEEIELYDGLALDEVVHHGSVDVGHGVGADTNDEAFQQVDLLGRVQNPAVVRSNKSKR